MALYCAVQFAGMGTILLATYKLTADYEGGYTMWALSYANIKPDNGARFVPVAMTWWCLISIVLFTIWKQKGMDRFKQGEKGDKEDGSTSKFTVWLKGVSMSATDEKLSGYFNKNFPDQVSSAKLVWDIHALGHNLRGRRNIIIKINKLQEFMGDKDNKDPDKTLSQINALKDKLKTAASQEPQLRARRLACAGSAFVTFNRSSDVNAFRKALASRDGSFPDDYGLNTSSWSAKMAPKPSEIYWENFGLTAAEKRTNHIKTLAAQLGMYAAFIFVSLGAVWCIGFDYMYYLYAMRPETWAVDFLCPQKDAVGNVIWYCVFALFFVICFLVLEEEMAPIIKFITKYDAPKTKSIKQSAYVGKCYWFYVIYHMVLSTTILGWLAANVIVDEDMHINARQGAVKLYVEAIGAFHQHRVFLTVGVIDMLHVLEGLSFFTRKGQELTAEEEDHRCVSRRCSGEWLVR